MNIENEGKIIVGMRCPELTLVNCPTMDEPTRNGMLKSSDRVKQEKIIILNDGIQIDPKNKIKK